MKEATLERLEELVNELTSQSPKTEKVQLLMQQLKIKYTSDPIDQLKLTLTRMQELKQEDMDNLDAEF